MRLPYLTKKSRPNYGRLFYSIILHRYVKLNYLLVIYICSEVIIYKSFEKI